VDRLERDRMFIAVMEPGSFTEAAERLGTSSGQASNGRGRLAIWGCRVGRDSQARQRRRCAAHSLWMIKLESLGRPMRLGWHSFDLWPLDPAVSLALVPILIGTIYTPHGAAGFFFSNEAGGREFPAFWAVTLIVQALLGDGAFALKCGNA
jgi:hypothetical protein